MRHTPARPEKDRSASGGRQGRTGVLPGSRERVRCCPRRTGAIPCIASAPEPDPQPKKAMIATLITLALLAPSPAALPAPSAPPQEARYVEEVRRLMREPRVERALRAVEEQDERTMEDLVELTEIAAPPFQEERRGARFLEKLLELGVDSAWVDEEGNVIGLRRGTPGAGAGAVVYSGHLDTVFPEETDVRVRRRGDTLYAPGIADDTRGLAAVLATLRAMNAAGVRTHKDVLFVGTVGEEGLGDLRGVKHLFGEGGPAVDAFISIDGTGDEGITHMGLGSHRYKVTFQGPGGHSWGAFGLGNPAHALGQAIHQFELAADAFTRSGTRTSYSVGRIGGGTSVNAIPFEAWMEVDMRSESQERLIRIDSIFQRSMRRALDEANAARRSGPELGVELALIGDRPSGEIPVGDPFVQRAIAVTRAMGLEPALRRSSTDANVPISMGIPALTIGGGGVSAGAHSPQEWYVNRDGPRGIQRAMLILLGQAGLAPAS